MEMKNMENPCTPQCERYERCCQYGFENNCGERKEYIKKEEKENNK